MKKDLFFAFFVLIFSNFLSVSILYSQENISLPPLPEEVILPTNYDELVKKSSGNLMEKRVDKIVGQALAKGGVVIEKVNDFLFLQVIPNYAYADERGEERLGEDLMAILRSGKIEAPRNSQFMNLNYQEMEAMGLPFKKKLIDSLVIGADKFDDSISLTFFININKLTNMTLNSLENAKDFKAVYNQSEKYYRTKFKDSKLLYFIRIPNMAYEIAYTGELFETVISKYIKEALFLKETLKDFERAIVKDEKLAFDGRYIKSKMGGDVLIDLWFLPEKTDLNLKKGREIMIKALRHEKITISGNEKQ